MKHLLILVILALAFCALVDYVNPHYGDCPRGSVSVSGVAMCK